MSMQVGVSLVHVIAQMICETEDPLKSTHQLSSTALASSAAIQQIALCVSPSWLLGTNQSLVWNDNG